MPDNDLTLDELQALQTSEATANEANAPETVPSGFYNFLAEKTRAFRDDKEVFPSGDSNPNFNRILIIFYGPLTDDLGARVGRFAVRTSPEERRGADGKLDKLSKTYYQMAAALGDKSMAPPALIEAAKAYPVRLSIGEWFRDEETGGFESAKSAEDRLALIQAGYTVGNSVRKIEKAR